VDYRVLVEAGPDCTVVAAGKLLLWRATREVVGPEYEMLVARWETLVEGMISMFARIQTLHQPADKLAEVAEAGRQQLPTLRELSGFKGCYCLIDRNDEKALVISLWETEEDVRQFEASTAERRRSAAQVGVEPPPSEIFEVALQAT
jgi:heme-degrading monooxygenase HmoA